MNLVTLSLKDLRRRPTRSLLTVAGVGLASATLFSLLAFNRGYQVSLKKEMADSGIHMLVSTEGCPMEAASLALHGGEIPKFLSEERVPAIRSVPGVRAVTGMLIFSVPG
ncbi:MAG: ABC transporter permease, partial [Chloroflexi bacterium]|nr:ABC transporter permease [Chloroflexota bacterium]